MNIRPAQGEFADFYAGYVSLVPETDVLKVLRDQLSDITKFAGTIPPQKELFRYAAGKWSVREVFGHIVDSERLFSFRAFAFGHGQTAPLPSFDENISVANSRYHERDLKDHVAEFCRLRESNLYLLTWLTEEAWSRIGTANNYSITVRALAFIMAGHVRHHFNVLRDRYGVAQST